MKVETALEAVSWAGEGKSNGINFVRLTAEDVEMVNEWSNEDLSGHYFSMVWMCYIYEQYSIADLQMVHLMELALEERGMLTEKFKADFDKWFKEEKHYMEDCIARQIDPISGEYY